MVIRILNNEQSLYIRGVALAPGLEDSYGDIVSQTQINTYITRFNNPKMDLEHSLINDDSINIIQSYLLDESEMFGTKKAPVGSWVIESRVKDESIKNSIINGEKNGLSVTTLSKGYLNSHGHNDFNFKSDLFFLNNPDLDDIIPHNISLVKSPANQFPIQYMNYNSYINRTSNKCLDGSCMVSKINTIDKKSSELHEISLKAWTGSSSSNYTLSEWKRACLVKVCDRDVKECYKLPIKNPDGTINLKGVASAHRMVSHVKGISESQINAIKKKLEKLM